MQVTELDLGGGPADASLWKTHYDYGELSTDGNSVDPTKNTGNIARQTLTVPGTSFVQSYRYDSLYRLTEAKETTGATQNWIQTWTYDRYGNRLSFTQNIAGNTVAPNPSVDTNTNRFNTGQGFVYDKNGNVTQDIDPTTSLSRLFIFNGDNKQTEVKNSSGVTIDRYYYDGEGKRVKKVTDTETTVFAYSAGKLVAEYSTQLATSPSVNYTTTDHLGSPRIITDELGQVKSRRDFMPFGEELYAGVGSRTGDTGLKYSATADSVRQKFTGYQKDNETSLDFAEARMYENRYGRFTAVDPLITSGKSSNPQTFNRYSYAGSEPVKRKDPDGKDWVIEIVKQKVQVSIKVGGKTRIVERTVTGQRPIYVPHGDVPAGIPTAPGVWGVNVGKNQGKFWALHPTENQSALFNTRADAEAQLDRWNNPKIQVVVWDPTWLPGSGVTWGNSSRGPAGHIAYGVDNQTRSWDYNGYQGESKKVPSFQDYLERNAQWRVGTVWTLDFGSPSKNREAASAIENYAPKPEFLNPQFLNLSPAGYDLFRANCGAAFCQMTEKIGIPADGSITPAGHKQFIDNTLTPFIIDRQVIGPPPTIHIGPVPFQDPCRHDARAC